MGFTAHGCENILKTGYYGSTAKELTDYDCSASSDTWFLTVLLVFN